MTGHRQQMDALHAIADLCLQAERAENQTAVREALRSAGEVFRADFFLFSMKAGQGLEDVPDVLLTNCPKRWMRWYDHNGAAAFDPVFEQASKFGAPFRWDCLYVSSQQKSLQIESQQCGMIFGCSASDRLHDGSAAILSLSGRYPIAVQAGEWERCAEGLTLLVGALQRRVSRMLRARRPNLADRLTEAERRCLAIMAAGATMAEAGERLGLRPRTVRYYLDRAAEKLDVDTPKDAILRAVALGLVNRNGLPALQFGGLAQSA